MHRTLLAEIRSGVLKPGDRLREIEIATRLAVSRTPVREALRLLEADGLVTHLPRQGASLRRLDAEEIAELYDLRAALEGTAAKLAARASGRRDWDELRALNRELQAARSAERAFDANRAFHLRLRLAARNRYLVKAMEHLDRTLLILGPTTLSAPERTTKAAAEHTRILSAIEAGDADAAEHLMVAHIEEGERRRLATIEPRLAAAESKR